MDCAFSISVDVTTAADIRTENLSDIGTDVGIELNNILTSSSGRILCLYYSTILNQYLYTSTVGV